MMKGTLIYPFLFSTLFCIVLASTYLCVEANSSHRTGSKPVRYLVPKQERKPLVVTEYGEVSAVKVSDGTKGPYHLQFITMEPNSLFLPVLLHADMVFYVHTGSGTLSWSTDDNEIKNVNIRKGDIFRLYPGSVFYVQNNLEPERERLRIHAIFSTTEDNIYEPLIGAYSSITDLIRGFDSKVLQAAFKVPHNVIEEILKAPKPAGIVHAVSKEKVVFCEWQTRLLKALLGSNRYKDGFDNSKKNKKAKAYNVFKEDPDFKNCNGWSLTVEKDDFKLLKGSNIGVFMVNLTKGSMMGPHWNPMASEIATVLHGEGMIRVVCASNANESECKNLRFRVKEGDVFAVPRFHPMAQMAFNNDSFVFMGFSTSTDKNYPQFLAGKSSILRILDRQILALSFNVTNTTIDQLLTPQKESVILDCTSCAEEEEAIMEEEIERAKEEEEERKREEEEAKKREEEEARKREEEEAKKREEEEEEARRREEEEEARKREEEEEEARRRKEEEAKREEEEARRREEEEEARKREEEARKREEEEARKREEEEEARKREEEEARKRREEEARKEQEEARRQEEERQRKAEEEARRERERQRGQPETRREGGYESKRRASKQVWEI